MFPAAMDVQRRRFFQATSHIAQAISHIVAAQESQQDRDSLVPYLQELGHAHRNSAFASGIARCSGARPTQPERPSQSDQGTPTQPERPRHAAQGA